jgi:hypothetical protein
VQDEHGDWEVDESHLAQPQPEEEDGGNTGLEQYVAAGSALGPFISAEKPRVEEPEDPGDPMDVDDGEHVNVEAKVNFIGQPISTHTLGTTTLADVCGLSKFQKERQLRESTAWAVADYRAYDPIDGEHVDVEAKVGFVESLKQGINRFLPKPKKHSSRHRCSNRYYRRVAVVKALVNKVRFDAPGIFSGSEADKRALHIIVRRVIKEALDEGVELPNTTATISGREAAWYLKAVCTSYYIMEEDDEWWDRLAEAGSAVTA